LARRAFWIAEQQRHRHRRADPLHDDRVRVGEARVHHRVRREHRGLLGDDLVHHRLGQDDVFLLGVLLLDEAGDQLSRRVHEQDDAAVGAEELERLVEDLGQELVEVELGAEGAGQLVGHAQLLVVAAQQAFVPDLALGEEIARGLGGDLVPDVAVGGGGRDGDALQGKVFRPLVDEQEARRSQRDLVGIGEDVLGDALAADVSAVQRTEVAEQETPVRHARDLRVLLGDDPVQHLDGVVRVAPDGVEGSELELLPVVAGDQDQFGHASRRWYAASAAAVKGHRVVRRRK
jgi:hypothetical protein